MGLEDFEAWIVEIKRFAEAGDFEAAHASEDALRLRVLRDIAGGRLRGARARELARLAVMTEAIDFERRCA